MQQGDCSAGVRYILNHKRRVFRLERLHLLLLITHLVNDLFMSLFNFIQKDKRENWLRNELPHVRLQAKHVDEPKHVLESQLIGVLSEQVCI